MTTDNLPKKRAAKFGPGLLPVVILGAALGAGVEYYFTGVLPAGPTRHALASVCLGIGAAYLALQWLRILADARSRMSDPIPVSLNVAEREAIREHAARLTGRGGLTRRARNLLDAWGLEWNPRPIIVLASFQSAQARGSLQAGAVSVALLFAVDAALGVGAQAAWAWAGLALLGVTFLARQNQLGCMDSYLEGRLLTRLPGNIPQTAMTAADLAAALGESIRTAFRDYVPRPEEAAAAMKEAVESVVKNVADEVAKLEKTLVDSQAPLVDRWMHAAEATTTDLKDVEKAVATVVTDLTGGLSTNAEKLQSMLAAHTKELDRVMSSVIGQIKDSAAASSTKLQTTLGQHVEQIGQAGHVWNDQLKGVFAEHAGSIQAANQAVAAQLAKIAELEKEVGNILHIQEAVEGAMKAVSASEEFQKTLAALRTHLQESDRLLAEVSKPRTIRLIETEEGVASSDQ
jgi:hypothetical protein